MNNSVIFKSQIEGAHRLDAEYYQPEYLELEKLFSSIQTKTIEEISKSVISFGAYSLTSNIEWQDSGVPYINVGDIHDGYIDFDKVKHISERVDEILNKSQVNNGQVLLTMAGTIGNAAVVEKLSRHVNANQAIAKITPSDEISPYFLAAFLNSRYGRLQTNREIVSSVQANIFLGTIKKFLIPVFNPQIRENIGKSYEKFLEKLEKSKSLYSQAETLLLDELGLKDFQESENLFSVVNLLDVKSAKRFDSEFFNSPCNKISTQLKKIKTTKLGDLVELTKGVESGAEAYQDAGKLFIRVSSVSKDGIIDKDQKYLSDDLYNEYKQDYQPQVGEILLTKDATPGVACAVRKPIEGIIASGVMRLKLKEKMSPEYLALVLNSIVGQAQAKRDAGGSIIAHWKPEQIKNVVIPILPISIQEKIADLVVKSHKARKKAKELLEEAKLKVEEMIESN